MSLNWFGALLMVVWVFQIAATILFIGQPREPITAGNAVFNLVINGSFILALTTVGTAP